MSFPPDRDASRAQAWILPDLSFESSSRSHMSDLSEFQSSSKDHRSRPRLAYHSTGELPRHHTRMTTKGQELHDSIRLIENNDSSGSNFQAENITEQVSEEETIDESTSEDREYILSEKDLMSECTNLDRRELNMFDVAAFIINKQIGSGILTFPGLVLSHTGSKKVSLVMWVVGGLWSYMSVLIYIEFGCAFPFNGGEMIYFDEVFRQPELLSVVLFSTFFISIPNTNGNAIQFANYVLTAASPQLLDSEPKDFQAFSKPLVSYLAISALSLACLIHYFSRNSGLLLNLLFAAFKIGLLLTLFFAGISCHAQQLENHESIIWDSHAKTRWDLLSALVYVIYAYQGWENANYIGGELHVQRKALLFGAFMAITVTTVLYTLVTLALSLVCTYEELTGSTADLVIIKQFVPKVFGESPKYQVTVSILFAISAFGALFSVVYTSSKVKQVIARQGFLPYWKFFAAEDPQFQSPYGALILHWIVATIWVACTPATFDGYSFVVGIFIYGQLIVSVFMGLAFLFIKKAYESDNARNQDRGLFGTIDRWKPVMMKSKGMRYVVAVIYALFNIAILVGGASHGEGRPPLWSRPVAIGVVLACGMVYWLFLYIIIHQSTPDSVLEVRMLVDGKENANASKEDRKALWLAKNMGDSRVLIWRCRGWLKELLHNVNYVCYKLLELVQR